MFGVMACGGDDPGGGNSGDAGGTSLGSLAGDDSGDWPPKPGHDAGTAAPVDAAPPPPVDPVVPGTFVPNPTDAFTGAGPYKSNLPTIRANDQHGGTIVTGKPCLSCHDGTTCTKFDFAGTVWQAPGLTQGAPDVEVRIIDANSYAHDVHSDPDGNFWHRADSDLALPAFSGVRISNWHAVGTLNGVSCNTCHQPDNTPPGRLYVQVQ